MAFDVDFFVIGAGSGGVRAARVAAELRRTNDRGRGEPGRRNLRHPRLRAEEALCVRQPLRRRFRRRRRLRLARRRRLVRLAKPRRRQGEGDHPAVGALIAPISQHQAPSRSKSARRSSARNACGSPTAGRSPRAIFLWRSARGRCFCLRSKGASTRSPPTRCSILPVIPRRLLMVGGGYIAVEFASLFQRLGSQVTRGMRAANVLRGFDEDMRCGLRDAMAHAGVKMRFGCTAEGHRKARRRRAAASTLTEGATRRRSGHDRDRPAAQHGGAWA